MLILPAIPLLINAAIGLMKIPFVLPIKFAIGICEDWEYRENHKKKLAAGSRRSTITRLKPDA